MPTRRVRQIGEAREVEQVVKSSGSLTHSIMEPHVETGGEEADYCRDAVAFSSNVELSNPATKPGRRLPWPNAWLTAELLMA